MIRKIVIWILLVLLVLDILFIFGVIVREAVDFPQTQPQQSSKLKKTNIYSNNRRVPKPLPILIELQKKETIPAEIGVKSLLMDKKGRFIYTFNLESMSVYEIERTSRKVNRKLVFKPTKAKGFDYVRKKWFESYAEKPVEGCFSHDEKYLWISLHNAGGVVAWNLHGQDIVKPDRHYKEATVFNNGKESPMKLPFIETGKTPKVIAKSPDGKKLFVSNWHGNNVSVININSLLHDDWKVIHNIKTGGVPRGLAISKNRDKLYAAQMGSGKISVINHKLNKVVQNINRGATPRHLLIDDSHLYVSLSSPEKLLKISLNDLTTVAEVQTMDDPRTITFSGDSTLIITTSYSANHVQVFSSNELKELASWESKGKPIGVTVYQKDDICEMWCCNYTSGTINIFTFKVIYEAPSVIANY